MRIFNKSKEYFKVIFAISILYYILQSGKLDLSSIGLFFQDTSGLVVSILLFLCTFIEISIPILRWHLLLKAQQFQLRLRRTIKISFIGNFFNCAIFGSLGGDVVKIFYLIKASRKEKTSAAMTVLMDRLIGLYTLFFFASLSCLLSLDLIMTSNALLSLASFSFGVFISLTLFFAISFYYLANENNLIYKAVAFLPLAEKITHVLRTTSEYRNHKISLFYAFLLSCCSQFIMIIVIFHIAKFLGEDKIPFTGYLLIVPIGVLTTVAPLTPGGIGVGQLAFYYLFNLFRGDISSLGADTFTFYQLMVAIVYLLGVFPFMTESRPEAITAGTVSDRVKKEGN